MGTRAEAPLPGEQWAGKSSNVMGRVIRLTSVGRGRVAYAVVISAEGRRSHPAGMMSVNTLYSAYERVALAPGAGHDVVVMTDDGAGTYEVRTVVFCGDCVQSLMERPASDGAITITEVLEVVAEHDRKARS